MTSQMYLTLSYSILFVCHGHYHSTVKFVILSLRLPTCVPSTKLQIVDIHFVVKANEYFRFHSVVTGYKISAMLHKS